MESVMFSSEDCESNQTSRIRHYKIASELKKYNLTRTMSKCFRIPENQAEADSTEDSMNNIFQCESIERVPETFVETAKEYEMVGYKYVKTTNQKKDKRKLNRKNTSSASSRHSKYSSSLPTLDRGILSKEILLERVKKLEEKENQLPIEPSRFTHSKVLLDCFSKQWQHQIKKDSELLHRNPADSLLNLSDAFRCKIERLQECRANEMRNNPRPDVWESTLCDGRSFRTQRIRDLQKTVGRVTIDSTRKLNSSLGCSRNVVPFIEVLGRSKLREQAQWLTKSPHKHFLPENRLRN